MQVNGSVRKLKASFECNLKNETEVKSFVSSYMQLSNETLRQNSSPHHLSEKNAYSEAFYYRCHHKTRCQSTMNPVELLKEKPSKRIKNTNCPFSLILKLKKTEGPFPCVVELEWDHNHPILALQSLSFKDIPENVSAEINHMYENGYTPGLACKEFIKSVKKSCQNDLEFHLRLADRSAVPKRIDFNNLFTEFNRKRYGSTNFEEVFNCLEKRIKVLHDENKELTLKFQGYNQKENTPFVLVIISPLMKRVHEKVNIRCSSFIFIPN